MAPWSATWIDEVPSAARAAMNSVTRSAYQQGGLRLVFSPSHGRPEGQVKQMLYSLRLGRRCARVGGGNGAATLSCSCTTRRRRASSRVWAWGVCLLVALHDETPAAKSIGEVEGVCSERLLPGRFASASE